MRSLSVARRLLAVIVDDRAHSAPHAEPYSIGTAALPLSRTRAAPQAHYESGDAAVVAAS
jgi:hypothetical protein